MTYMAGESPQGPEGRRDEADRLVNMLAGYVDLMEPHERKFVLQAQDRPISVKQLYWLRDLKGKYAE